MKFILALRFTFIALVVIPTLSFAGEFPVFEAEASGKQSQTLHVSIKDLSSYPMDLFGLIVSRQHLAKQVTAMTCIGRSGSCCLEFASDGALNETAALLGLIEKAHPGEIKLTGDPDKTCG